MTLVRSFADVRSVGFLEALLSYTILICLVINFGYLTGILREEKLPHEHQPAIELVRMFIRRPSGPQRASEESFSLLDETQGQISQSWTYRDTQGRILTEL